MYETTLKLLEDGYFEVQFAFEGLTDEKVWTRPHPKLLSIGELAGHIAYGEATRLAGEGEDLSKCRIQSPLIDARFWYYPTSLDATLGEEQFSMTAQQVYEELIRIHQECIVQFKALNPAPDTPIPGCRSGFTYGTYLDYAVFHIAYHTGQMYSVRHLLGDETNDN